VTLFSNFNCFFFLQDVNVSPTSIPKKRLKYSFKNKNKIEATIVQTTTNDRDKLTEVTESSDCMSSDNDANRQYIHH